MSMLFTRDPSPVYQNSHRLVDRGKTEISFLNSLYDVRWLTMVSFVHSR